jgi:DNA-binding MarR family transcriptional regulator
MFDRPWRHNTEAATEAQKNNAPQYKRKVTAMTWEPVESVLPEAAADLIARLRRAMRKAARARAPGMPLSVAQLELLSLVEEHPGARPGDLAGRLRLAANSVSTLANAMVIAGMLDRSPGATDKRTVAFTLTPQGARLVGRWRSTNESLLQSAIAALGAADRIVLTEALPALERLVEAIDQQGQTPAEVAIS